MSADPLKSNDGGGKMENEAVCVCAWRGWIMLLMASRLCTREPYTKDEQGSNDWSSELLDL